MSWCCNFDVGNACFGFFDGMEMVVVMIECGAIDYGFVVDGEGSCFVVECTIERLNVIGDACSLGEEFAMFTLGLGVVVMVFVCRDLVLEVHLFCGSVAFVVIDWNYLCCGQVDCMVIDV